MSLNILRNLFTTISEPLIGEIETRIWSDFLSFFIKALSYVFSEN